MKILGINFVCIYINFIKVKHIIIIYINIFLIIYIFLMTSGPWSYLFFLWLVILFELYSVISLHLFDFCASFTKKFKIIYFL